MSKLVDNPPSANILMNSMRAVGYSFETAVADIVDNSISANATVIEVLFPISKDEEYVCICDNGVGMSHEELLDAMKYGSTNKFSNRDSLDLGRFGLGLKTSSFSQCNKLTVISKKDNGYSAFTWDLDYILTSSSSQWCLQEHSLEEMVCMPNFSFLKNIESGTVVIWQNFDIIKKSSKDSVYDVLLKYRNRLNNHLALVFHRFLAKGLVIKICNYSVIPLDPFLENHNKTTILRKICLNVKDSQGIDRNVVVQPYILPYQKYMSKEDFKKVGGVNRYRSMQGFYIYRNERLITYGTWFNRPKEELSKYARIKVDIPNTLDDIWEIDIKKQKAKIPSCIEDQLNKTIDDVINGSKRVQSYRGRKTTTNPNVEYLWERKDCRGSFEYSINRNSQLMSALKLSINDSSIWDKFERVLKQIEKSLPYHQIYLDEAQNRIANPVYYNECDVEELARTLIDISLNNGYDKKSAIEKIFLEEPFINYPNLKIRLLKEDL